MIRNCIDMHNHVHQYELSLEKCGVTQDSYFRLHTAIIRMNVADCWKLVDYYGFFDGLPSYQYCAAQHSMLIKKFAGVLSFQLIEF